MKPHILLPSCYSFFYIKCVLIRLVPLLPNQLKLHCFKPASYPVKVWANAILTVDSPECLAVRLTVRSQWSHCYHCMLSSSVDLTNRSQQAHGVRCKLTEDSQEGHSCEIISWVCCKVDEWFQNELAVRFHVNLQCVSCELKFFTGSGSGHEGMISASLHLHWAVL